MKLLKIALLQIAPCSTLTENLEKGLEACKKAKEMGLTLHCSLKCGAMDITSTGRLMSGKRKQFQWTVNL